MSQTAVPVAPPEPVPPAWIVRIELQRIQTFLFAVPRLRAMLGANALLGHSRRCVLPGLAKGCSVLNYQPTGQSPADDPLRAVNPEPSDSLTNLDDPKACYHRGILARDGGHLTIAFVDEPTARAFIDQAFAELAQNLPDLPVSIRLVKWEDKDKSNAGEEQTPATAQLADIPQFQGCTESGFGVASKPDQRSKPDTDPDTGLPTYRSFQTRCKMQAGFDFQRQPDKYKDLVSLLAHGLPGYGSCINPDDLKDLSDAGGYIALIHADGNRIGQRLNDYRASWAKGTLQYETQTEHFFHHMRVTARAAVVTALERTFSPEVLAQHPKCIPYQLLMLGGDDLLLLCQPQYALTFTLEYARALKHRPPLPDDKRLSIGAGIVIAKHSLPFHRLHALAEGLAGSAKRAYLQRCPDGTHVERSVADWMILTTSWGEDPEAFRRRHDLVIYPLAADQTETLALTAKPYFILRDDLAEPAREVALEDLVSAADRLTGQAQAGPESEPASAPAPAADQPGQAHSAPTLPRSQFKDLIGQLGEGRRWAELCYAEVRERLNNAQRTAIDERITPNGALWQVAADNGQHHLTYLRDLIELTELRYLGRRKQALDQQDVAQPQRITPDQEKQPHD